MIGDEQYESKTDEEIVRLTLDNQANFLHIIRRYKTKLYNYIRRISGLDADETEDVLQVVFLKAYQNLNDFDTDLKFSSWIYRIAHNEVISHYRKKQARPQKSLIDLDDDAISKLASDIDPAREADGMLLKKRVSGVLNRLDEKYREAIILKFFEEKSYQEISDIIKKPMGTVASLLNRAKEEFKKEYRKQHEKEL